MLFEEYNKDEKDILNNETSSKFVENRWINQIILSMDRTLEQPAAQEGVKPLITRDIFCETVLKEFSIPLRIRDYIGVKTLGMREYVARVQRPIMQ